MVYRIVYCKSLFTVKYAAKARYFVKHQAESCTAEVSYNYFEIGEQKEIL